MTNAKKLIPLVGFGDVRFGMTVKEVTKLLGAPSEKNENVQYGDEPDDVSTELIYDELGISLSFDKVADFRLADIMTEEGTEFAINDVIRIGAKKEDVLKSAIEDEDFGPYEPIDLTEDMSAEELEEAKKENLEEIEFEEVNVNFWFKNGVLDTIQLGPEFDDNDNIVWPEE